MSSRRRLKNRLGRIPSSSCRYAIPVSVTCSVSNHICCILMHHTSQELGVAAADIKKLKEGGVNTVEALAHATKRELCAIKGMSEAKVVKLQLEGEEAEML